MVIMVTLSEIVTVGAVLVPSGIGITGIGVGAILVCEIPETIEGPGKKI